MLTQISSMQNIDNTLFFDHYFLENRPLVLRGGGRHWPAVERWCSDAYLRQRAGIRHIAQTRSSRDDVGFDHQSPIDVGRFRNFLDHYAEDRRLYVNDANMPSVLVSDLGNSPLLEAFGRLENRKRRVGMFMGSGEQFAPLHYDDEDNIYIVIAGEKHFTLYDIADFTRLYPYDDLYQPDFSQIPDPDAVDLNAFPKFAEATRWDIRLLPGDMLYVPAYAWHTVRSVGRSIALSYVRLDRRAQRVVYRKLLQAGVFPIDAAQRRRVEALLDAPSGSAQEMATELERGKLDFSDLFALYARLISRYCEAIDGGEDPKPVERDFLTHRDELCGHLQAKAGVWSYPVLYLMQNFFAVNIHLFRDHGLDGEGTSP